MQVGIAHRDMRVEAMSGGQRRKVAVASALIGSPDMLILDEPTNHMDVQARCFLVCGCICPAATGRCWMMCSANTLPALVCSARCAQAWLHRKLAWQHGHVGLHVAQLLAGVPWQTPGTCAPDI